MPGQGHAPLAHDYGVVTLVLHGRLDEVFVRDTQRCGRWELHYKPAGARHATATGPAGVRMFVMALGGDATAIDLPAGPRVLGGGVQAARALRIFASLAGPREHALPVGRDAVQRLVASLERDASAGTVVRPTWITEAHERIRAEDGCREPLGRLALRFRVHPGHLARTFRKHYDTSIGSFRRRVRAEHAIEHLIEGSRPLADLAHDLGYADQSHFTREFKRETGWAPGRFRTAAASWSRIPRD
ncbi:MAG: helix-turn-helix transcriptional regulator [bacterium]|nr:helix-turn-helix transcriptional regulator [bacterium]